MIRQLLNIIILLNLTQTVLAAFPLSSAGPRPGLVVIVDVDLHEADALTTLSQQGYDISHVIGQTATIYATPEELTRLKVAGFTYREIAQQTATPTITQEHSTFYNRRGTTKVQYHTYASLTEILQSFADNYPDICRLTSLGQSFQGRELWAILITDQPDIEEDEPEFKYDGTIHGDEPVGMEMCVRMIDLLLTQYQKEDRITNLVDNTAIWFIPLMNPDGLELKRRYSAQGWDLNRSYPQILFDQDWNHYQGTPLNETGRPHETQHLMRWAVNQNFTLAATLHTGILLVAYPYATNTTGRSQDSPTPDDAIIESLSLEYSRLNAPMRQHIMFPEGIVNMASLYVAEGTTADWYYAYLGTIEFVPELSWTKWPAASTLPLLWEDNREAMLSLMESAHTGIHGLVREHTTEAPIWAEVLIEKNAHSIFTDPNVGDYHRVLLPGTYDLIFKATGYLPRHAKNILVTDEAATRKDITLLPEQASPDFNQDFIINQDDLDILLAHWHQNEPKIDIAPLPNGDGIIDDLDQALLMEFWEEEIPRTSEVETRPNRRR